MKVLFVSSGNAASGISPLVLSQAESLIERGIGVDFFPIIGKGVCGYLKNIFRLHRYLRRHDFDLVHAHYLYCGIVAALASRLPVVVSLMGSDVRGGRLLKTTAVFMNRFLWQATIVKSARMKEDVPLLRAYVIPNGVDVLRFRPLDRDEARRKVGFNDKKHVIFVAAPARREKNFALAREAFELIGDGDCELHVIAGADHESIPWYMNAADVLLLTSLWEGSPNVIKEAMACNCPIVSTDVGDVREIFGDTAGCYLCSYDKTDVAEKLRAALAFAGRTTGRERIIRLDSRVVAEQISSLYEKVLDEARC